MKDVVPVTEAGESRPRTRGAPALPEPRGPLTELLDDHLRRPAHTIGRAPQVEGDALVSEDIALALYVCYELHYSSFAGVDDMWEWEPSLLQFRGELERAFERSLFERLGPPRPADDRLVARELVALTNGCGPSLSAFMLEDGTISEFREFAIHRSLYQLKEADPYTFAIPRLCGEPKAAMVAIQMGEYGDGRADRMHSELFGETLRGLGLDDRYGFYLDAAPATTLNTVNLISLFGLHRRWRGAAVGHLALFEMSSVVPMGRYAAALRAFGLPASAIEFYDEHVIADRDHAVIALNHLATRLATDEPDLAATIIFGARALDLVERSFSGHLIESWQAGASSLRSPAERGSPARW